MAYIPTRRVACIVLSFGGSLIGWKNKLFAIPREVLLLETTESGHEGRHDKPLLINAFGEGLEKAPGVDRDNWTDTGEFEWVAPLCECHELGPFQI